MATHATPAPRLHVAIIMDGNGRWATARGEPRTAGHEHGASVVSTIVEAAATRPIGTLTLYAFSADNWRRPGAEVRELLAIFNRYLVSHLDQAVDRGLRFSLIGRRDRLPPSLRRSAELVEMMTSFGEALHLRLAIDYSGRDAIWAAVERARRDQTMTRDDFDRAVRSGRGEPADVPDVDLLIRTGGDLRLSDFLLWESAYAELHFTDVPWPAFTPSDLDRALADYGRRERRFGGLAPATAGEAVSRVR